MTSKLVHILNAGRTPYREGLNLQRFISNQIIENKWKYQNVLILTEHEPVYTIGIRTNNYNKEDEERLKKLGADFYKTSRGGLITFHGPGQLISYPILNLKNFHQSVRWYVGKIEKSIIDLCQKYDLEAEITKDTGVWIEGKRKICAIGIHVSRHVTSHGLALNCNTDLNWFNHIVPCGLEGKEVTSLSKECKQDVSKDDVIPNYIDSFEKIFDCQTVNIDKEEVDEIKRLSKE
ncbi:octanoyl-[acyl-carrier-protein]:protein N-octanoyltransferase LIPT2, mitochondrial [Chironomus tepperi]|uniref:octanoyl-[acyl-carrier-protein]:protein N-octanoyltransferase LIPT2, mitochondrial n=1 Tax=Chironomus tepperi TaxID=113505 RepID=UPI00391F5AB2